MYILCYCVYFICWCDSVCLLTLYISCRCTEASYSGFPVVILSGCVGDYAAVRLACYLTIHSLSCALPNIFIQSMHVLSTHICETIYYAAVVQLLSNYQSICFHESLLVCSSGWPEIVLIKYNPALHLHLSCSICCGHVSMLSQITPRNFVICTTGMPWF